MTDMPEMPADEVMPCAYEIMAVLRKHISAHEQSRENVFVSLNALAIASAFVLSGTRGAAGEKPSAHALRFFNDAMSRQIRELTGGDAEKLNG
jgi:hypothetical protein